MDILYRTRGNPVWFYLTREQKRLLELAATNGYTSFPFPLVYTLLKSVAANNDNSDIQAPAQGWGSPPIPSDVSPTDDIERIRIIHEFYNSLLQKASLPDHEYNEHLQVLMDVSFRMKSSLGPDYPMTLQEITDSPVPTDAQHFATACRAVCGFGSEICKEHIAKFFPDKGTVQRFRDDNFERLNEKERMLLNILLDEGCDSFDVNMCYTVVKIFTQEKGPLRGWGKDPWYKNTSFSADVERLNRLDIQLREQTPTVSLTEAEFEKISFALHDICRRMTERLNRNVIHELRTICRVRIPDNEGAIEQNGNVSENDPEGMPTYTLLQDLVVCNNEILGRGSCGTVVVRGMLSRRRVAVKRILKHNTRERETETEILREHDIHPNIISYFYEVEDPIFIYLVLELCLGNLQEYVEKKIVINSTATEMMNQMLSGIEYLHQHGIVHRDIKPSNILFRPVNNNQSVRTVVSDFGLSQRLLDQRFSFSYGSNIAGSMGWMAPEVAPEKRMTIEIDIFSAGCVTGYAFSKGKHPFGDNVLLREFRIMTKRHYLKSLQDYFDEDNVTKRHLVEWMIEHDSCKRPKAKDTLCHPCFWKKPKKCQFFENISDFLERNRGYNVNCLERHAKEIFKKDWIKELPKELIGALQEKRSYNCSSVADLLRALRNTAHHFHQMPAEVQKIVGKSKEDVIDFFTNTFPALTIYSYIGMKQFKYQSSLKDYY